MFKEIETHSEQSDEEVNRYIKYREEQKQKEDNQLNDQVQEEEESDQDDYEGLQTLNDFIMNSEETDQMAEDGILKVATHPQNTKFVNQAYQRKMETMVQDLHAQQGIEKKGKTKNFLKKLVSKKKRRYQQNGFDLDLCYITDNIIAMGFPARSFESIYRNHYKDVKRFLQQTHGDKYKVYNLCTENQYPDTLFPRMTRQFAFEDHMPPAFNKLLAFCKSLHQFLSQDPQNVGVVHCKAGKGRTGTMICSYLLYCNKFKRALDSLTYYGIARTYNHKGVTIPSQIRYVYYFEQLLQLGLEEMPIRPALLNRIRFISTPRSSILSPGSKISFKIKCPLFKGNLDHLAKEVKPGIPYFDFSVPESENVLLGEDVFIGFYIKAPLKGKKKLLHFWFHTSFVDSNGVLTLNKNLIDKAAKDKDHQKFTESFKIQLFMVFPMNPNLSEEIYELTDEALKDPVAKEIMKIPGMAPTYCRKFSF